MILSALFYNSPEKAPYGITQLFENYCSMWHRHNFQPTFPSHHPHVKLNTAAADQHDSEELKVQLS